MDLSFLTIATSPPPKRRSTSPAPQTDTLVQDNQPVRNTNATPPTVFFANMATDSAYLTANPYMNGKTDDFVHFCGTNCRKAACHNVGPPGTSKSLAMYGVCDFCHNSSRTDITVTRTCTSQMHVVRVGTLAKHVWFGVLNPSKPLPSSGKTTQDATRDIDFRFKNGGLRPPQHMEFQEKPTEIGASLASNNEESTTL